MSGGKLTSKKLVIGASGFLGSHVTRQLVERGDDVRVMLRETSSTRGIDDLDVERVYGDVFDDRALRAAMVDCDVVYYCVVDARAWLRDPSPLFRTNVEGLRYVLDAPCEANLKRFVFTSTIATLAIGDGSPVTEADPFDWHDGGPYVESRVAAETSSCNMPATKAYQPWRCAFPPPTVPGTGNRRLTADSWHSSPPADGPSTSRTRWRSSVSRMPHMRWCWLVTKAESESGTS